MPDPLFNKGDVLLCVKDFRMTSGELAFKKGGKYKIDRVITYVDRKWVDYDMDSIISSKHTMPEEDLKKHFKPIEESEINNRVYYVLQWIAKGVWRDNKSSIGNLRQCYFCHRSPQSTHVDDCPVRIAKEVLSEGDY